MPVCPQCGQENPEDARFCNACAAPLPRGPVPRETRKTVTVLFCDVAGYTEAGERLDPEALRKLQSRYFDDARAALERHGATVEKFIGDAVMAVFGIPQVHEDDALRAARAAVELRKGIAELGLQARIGINTGEVVAGSGDALVTGDAVNIAARLEQAAEPGVILIGDATHRLLSGAVTSELVGPLSAKGKAEPLQAWQLVHVRPDAEAVARRLDSPMVGRERERALLLQAFERARDERACHLFTILGPAGVGKSRLIAELVRELSDDATGLSGRCLPYGEGITFWPLYEVLEAAGDERSRTVRKRLESGASSPEELFFSVRKLFEEIARERPLVVVFDDVHWAQQTFLDFVDHVSDWSRDAPILLICLARPELLDERPAWGGGKLNATSVLLEPLASRECEVLVRNLLGQAELAEGPLRRILEAAEGNPLFVEEMLEMLIDDGLLEPRNGSWKAIGDLSDISVPPTIHALVAARLDRLTSEERSVAERGAVEGRVFHRGAVVELVPDPIKPNVSGLLHTLVRKELARPDEPEFEDEDAFRFRHLLLRDAAYESLPKETRAELHERFADWLEAKAGVRLSEYEEILGYHLEQAYRCRAELGAMAEELAVLAARAAEILARAGRRAAARADAAGTVSLLGRALDILPSDHADRPDLLIAVGYAAREVGDYQRSLAAAQELIRLGEERDDPRVGWSGKVLELHVRFNTDPSALTEEAEATAKAALPVFEAAGDEMGLARAWHLHSDVDWLLTRNEARAEKLEHALEHAHRAGDTSHEGEIMRWLGASLVFGPTPVDQAATRFEEMLAEARARAMPSVEGVMLRFLGAIEAFRGRFDEARSLFERGRAMLEELGLSSWLAGQTQLSGFAESLAGDDRAAERELRFGYDLLEQMGETGVRSTSAGLLAEVLYERGRYEEAERYVTVCRETSAADDLASQIAWRSVEARLLARRGDFEQGERFAREAVGLASPDDILFQARAWAALGETLAFAGRRAEGTTAFEEAIRPYERKGSTAGVAMIERRRAKLGLEAQ
jgi:class 3 adenylate cyclase/tetratricopeptide (TPR) repeat protein